MATCQFASKANPYNGASMHVGVCAAMRAGVRIDMRIRMCIGMRMGIRTDNIAGPVFRAPTGSPMRPSLYRPYLHPP